MYDFTQTVLDSDHSVVLIRISHEVTADEPTRHKFNQLECKHARSGKFTPVLHVFFIFYINL